MGRNFSGEFRDVSRAGISHEEDERMSWEAVCLCLLYRLVVHAGHRCPGRGWGAAQTTNHSVDTQSEGLAHRSRGLRDWEWWGLGLSSFNH